MRKGKKTVDKALWPVDVMQEIQMVMEEGERAGKRGWEKEYVSNHIHKAEAHLLAYFTAGADSDEDHLAHAFTRLMMAMAIERGYVKGTR